MSVYLLSHPEKKEGKTLCKIPLQGFVFSYLPDQPYQSRHEPRRRRGSSVHLGTKWVPKWAAAGAIWQRCSKMPRDAQFRPSQRCVATFKRPIISKAARRHGRHLDGSVRVWPTCGAEGRREDELHRWIDCCPRVQFSSIRWGIIEKNYNLLLFQHMKQDKNIFPQ